jgi:predicted RNase H-like HicB family nuclease
MENLTPKDKQEVRRLSALLPHEVSVGVRRSEDGGFVAEVASFPGVMTQGETFSELVAMVNDAVLTYFDIPEQYRAFVPSYLPPIDQAASLSVFPSAPSRSEEEVTLQLAVRGQAASR